MFAQARIGSPGNEGDQREPVAHADRRARAVDRNDVWTDYGFVIGYDADPPYGTGAVPGRGSAFSCHVRTTGGDEWLRRRQRHEMMWLFRW